jgi:hypothetical protein
MCKANRNVVNSAPAQSLHAIMLRMWLQELDQNALSVLLGTDMMVSGDWLILALSSMGGQKSWATVFRAFAMRLIQKGNLHTAAMCLLALDDKQGAVEVYISHKQYM